MAQMNTYATSYEVPAYALRKGEAWFHFLHGNVPGHQIDYIYRPEVPQGHLTRQHFSHLTRLLKYIEPRHGSAYAFAIANLSRDDTQYEPGHGAIALIFGLRIKGVKDHAGREDPPFCHAAGLVNRHVDEKALHKAALQFHTKLLADEKQPGKGRFWYQAYVGKVHAREALATLLRNYVDDFAGLHAPGPSGLTLRWSVEKSAPPRRVVIVYPDDTDFATLSRAMTRIANVLVESDIKWTAISNGREQDVLGGVTVRFVPLRDAMVEAADVVVTRLEDVPEKPADLAAQLFHAHEVRISQVAVRAMNWRHGQALPQAVESPAATMARPERSALVEEGAGAAPEVMFAPPGRATELKQKHQKQQFTTLVGFGALIAVLGVLAVVWIGSAPKEEASPVNATPMVSASPPARARVSNVVAADAEPIVDEQPEATATRATQTNEKPTPRIRSTAKTEKAKGDVWDKGLTIPGKKTGN
jgi:hypothetical protein